MSNIADKFKSKLNSEKGTAIKNKVTGVWKHDDAPASDYSAATHVSRPISSLRDPSSFGPPPRHVALTGRTPSPHGSTRSSSNQAVVPAGRPPLPTRTASSLSTMSHRTTLTAAAPDDDREPPQPPRPYRVDTTGLSTANLPPPPVRRDGADGGNRLPPRPSAVTRAATTPAAAPSLPPRLPPRSSPATSTTASPLPSPAAADGYLNQAAVNRLSNAGISVPGLGIGGGSHAAPALSAVAAAAASSSAVHKPATPQMSELQARFAKMGTGAASPAPVAAAAKKKPPPPPPGKKKPALTAAAYAPPPPLVSRHVADANDDDDDDDVPPPIPMATRPDRW